MFLLMLLTFLFHSHYIMLRKKNKKKDSATKN